MGRALPPFFVRGYALLLGLVATLLTTGGGWLILLGGSAYYLAAGLLLFASAVLLWQHRRAGVRLYGIILLITAVWAIGEAGFDSWALMPRLAAWIVLGLVMITPWFRRALRQNGTASPHQRTVFYAGGALIAAVAAGGLLHLAYPGPHDPRFQAGVTPFPTRGGQARFSGPSGEWPSWGNDPGGARFSPLTQITPANVSALKVAWRAPLALTAQAAGAGLEVTPLMVGGVLFACNNMDQVFAMDAETGRERWHADTAGIWGRTCRGVAYYRVPGGTGSCPERIIVGTGAATLIALDAKTGQRCPNFGVSGKVDLEAGLSKAPEAYYHVTSAPAVVRGRIVVGGWISDGQYWGEPSGVIRAFDAVTGTLAWAWDMGRSDRTDAPPPGDTYTPATPNSWAPISSDDKLGLVYLPMGNATPDYFGAQRRSFDDRYSSSVVALDAETGKPRWSFQTVHHDLWDYDVASQPTLIDLPQAVGGTRAALVQLTKRGEIFLLDRATGRPLRTVEERQAPQSGAVPEERVSATQPYSPGFPSFAGPKLRESDMWGITPLDQMVCRIRFRQARFEGTMTPPGLKPWIAAPGYVGGMDWGGASIDADDGVMIVNSARLVNYDRLLTRPQARVAGLKPVGANAPVMEVGRSVPQWGTPYGAQIAPFMSALGIPCQQPPYGFISAVDLVSGKLVWSRPLGTAKDTGPLGIRLGLPLVVGTPNIGGSVTTRSGVAFIGASADRTFRAFDIRSGRELWHANLPRGAFANPMTYLSPSSGRQFVVVAVGGKHGLGETDGAELWAFALPAHPLNGKRGS